MTRSLTILFALLIAAPAAAQQISLDRPVRAGGLVFFGSLEQEGTYYYAPTRARLAEEDGRPKFSFLRYVENVEDATRKVSEGEGGGIVHAVVELGVTDEDLDEARRELARAVPGATVAGPVVFRSGRFGLVSTAADESGAIATKVVGVGSAPVLEGGRAAVSILLTRLGAKTLWQSFQMATPDVSFLFEMQMDGYRAPQRAVIEADLDRVYSHEAFALGVATTYVQTDVQQAFDDLRQDGSIRLMQIGEDEDLDQLVQTAYTKLSELIFQPATGAVPAQAAGAERKSALDRASELLEARRKETREENARIRERRDVLAKLAQEQRDAAAKAAKDAAAKAKAGKAGKGEDLEAEAVYAADQAALAEAVGEAVAIQGGGGETEGAEEEEQPLPDFAAVMTYEMKRSRQQGQYRIDLNKATAATLPLRFDANVGDLRRHLGDEAVFRSVNLDDPMYRQREIVASLQGVDAKTFETLLAFASVELMKEHESGETTLREAVIDRDSFSADGNRAKLVYGWKGDGDRAAWAHYRYRTVWGFHDTDPVEGEWQETDLPVIPMRPPFASRRLQLEAFDENALKDAGVRSVTVTVYADLGGEERKTRATLHTLKGELSKNLDVLLPRDADDYEYEIRWTLKGNQSLTSGRQRSDQDFLYLDEVPETSARARGGPRTS